MGISPQSHKVRVSESGRVSIPADMRRALGLEKGGVVKLELIDGGLRLWTMHEVRERIQAMARETGWTDKTSVDEFLAWRAKEAQIEAKKMLRK